MVISNCTRRQMNEKKNNNTECRKRIVKSRNGIDKWNARNIDSIYSASYPCKALLFQWNILQWEPKRAWKRNLWCQRWNDAHATFAYRLYGFCFVFECLFASFLFFSLTFFFACIAFCCLVAFSFRIQISRHSCAVANSYTLEIYLFFSCNNCKLQSTKLWDSVYNNTGIL